MLRPLFFGTEDTLMNGSIPMQTDVKLSCRNVWKVFGAHPDKFFNNRDGLLSDPQNTLRAIRESQHIPACADVSFDVHVGEIFVIMGLSGSGKSTVVRCMSRLVDATAGQVLLDGEDLLSVSHKDLIEYRRHKMGMVFQNFGLMPHLSVLENVAFPLELQGVSRSERLKRAHQMIETVGLKGRETSFPHQLSGGQQQRVGIARSLAVEPELWFLDEPFSALDPLIRRQMQDEFLRLQRELHKSIVFITHDFLEAIRIADRMAIMKDGQIVQIGRPVDLILNPANDYVREFTNDVPWELVLTAGDIASDNPAPTGIRQVSASDNIASLLPFLADHDDGVAVPNATGPARHLTSRDVIAALASGVRDTETAES